MQKYLVTGGSGKLSRQVIRFLLEDFNIKPQNIITTTRDTSKLEDLSKLGIEVRQANFDDETSLKKAFEGATKLLLVSTNEIGKRLAQHTNAINAAKAVGVEHLVYTSMPNPASSPITFAGEHKGSEEALENSGISSYTILRNNWYFENFVELQADMFKGHWLNATKEGKVSYLSRVDLAFAAAYALVNKEDSKEILTLAGSEALSIDEVIAAIKEVTGIEIQNINVSLEEFKTQLEGFSLPKDVVEMVASFEEHNEKNLSNLDSNDFEKLSSKKAKTFKNWLEDNKELILAL